MNSTVSIKPWREIIQPHDDVASGKYHQAEFAADLAQVIVNGAEPEYQEPNEFFKRTYITEGMSEFLLNSVDRLANSKGDPVIQLKTSFGGGKTHTMLALYHLFNPELEIQKNENLKELFSNGKIGISKTSIAVLVGTAMNATGEMNHGEIKVKTPWGYMAAQLGNDQALSMIEQDDKAGTAPGSDILVKMFNDFGPCLIILDELVAYARNIYGKQSELVNCSFDSLMTFIQNLTEAAKRSKNTLVVASIPESDIEIGGDAGKKSLERIENIFGRLEKVWKPVKPMEAFEIVRRRLFNPITNENGRDEVCNAFSKLYIQNPSLFPSSCKEGAYFERLKKSYPIHPEVFDRLYDDWSEIENFQRTRGVLRLMATVIHELWIQNDRSFLIMPGSIPIYSKSVHAELTRYLSDQWNSILDSDVDGERSEPRKIDEENPRLGNYIASRRVSRTIFLGSAPSVEAQKVRGIEDVRIRLGIIQPGEPIPIFDDALEKLLEKLVHLYGENKRYWFDTRANLRRTVEDRASRQDSLDIKNEIERRLQTREREDFSSIHIFPTSEGIPDDPEVKLIVMPLNASHKQGLIESDGLKLSKEILMNRGDLPRHNANMMIFVSPDKTLLEDLEKSTRQYLAWKSVNDDWESLDLKVAERKQSEEFTKQTSQILNKKIHETYCWLLIPTQEDSSKMDWEITKIPGAENYPLKISKKLRESEFLVSKWSPALLKMELDKWLWKEEPHILIKTLWENLCTYPYLTRLKNSEVLLSTIRDGVSSKDFFGYANNIDENKNYVGLKYDTPDSEVYLDSTSFLVKPEIAKQQIMKQELAENVQNETTPTEKSMESNMNNSLESASDTKTRFYGNIVLDWTTIAPKTGEIASEVIEHLKSLKNSNVEISLEIIGTIPEGIPEDVVRTVSENCKTLKFTNWEFSKE